MRTAVICDTESLYKELKQRFNKRLQYGQYLAWLKSSFDYDCAIKVAYGNQKNTVVQRFISTLNQLGFQTHFKYGKDWHVEVILQCVSIANKVDVVVLGTSDPVYAPMIPWLEAHGVKVHVVSCNIPHQLSELALCHEIQKEVLVVDALDPAE